MVLGGVAVVVVSRAFSGVSLLIRTSVHTISSDVVTDGDRHTVVSLSLVVCASPMSMVLEVLGSFDVMSSVFACSMVATMPDISVLVDMLPIGIALPNFPANVLVRARVDLRISGEFVSGVDFRSIRLAAGCLLGDGVLWSSSISDESEIEVSQSNSIVAGSALAFFDFAGRRCVAGLLLLLAFF